MGENQISKNDLLFSQEQVNQIIDEVISGIKEDWPTIYKIRYIYLEIGKRLYRDTDFFFSVDGKLGEANLSLEKIKEIYNSEFGRNLEVICRSASCILKKSYDKIGVHSELVETNTTIAALSGEEEFLINHWFLAIYDNDIAYFATLTPDLPYIQMNMETKHFASDIPYTRNYNGKIMQIYKGPEIKHQVISRDRLKKIDIEIGYIQKSYLYNEKFQADHNWFLQYDNASLFMLRDSMRENKLFYELETYQTPFYNSLFEFEGSNHKKISLLSDNLESLTDNDWNEWLKLICRQVIDKIENLLGYKLNVIPSLESMHWNYNSWLLNLCVQIQFDLFKSLNQQGEEDFRDVIIDVENFKYNKWSRKVKQKFHIAKNDFDYDNILIILDKTNALINSVKNKSGNLRNLISSLAYHFIDSAHLYENNILSDGQLSNYYIANKFDKLFRTVFNCNELITPFNQMGYSEQAVIIKEVINMMFPEVTKNNSSMLPGYNDNYNAVFNRIHIYPIKNKNNDEYAILFNILGNNQNGDYYFFYNPRKNSFCISNILDIYNDYIIISERMKNRMSIDDLEKIDEIQEKKVKK